MANISVLLVEDEKNIASFIAMYLRKEGFTVETAESGSEGISLASGKRPQLVILDIMLPDIDGFEVCRRLRRESDVPIIMLTARDTPTDKVVGLELGADDYVTKPFDPRELVARVKSVLRRSQAGGQEPAGPVTAGEVTLDPARHEVSAAGGEVKLTAKEFDLLHYLMVNSGLALSRDRLLQQVWGYDFAGDTRTVDVHINQLRKKLGAAAEIETVRGIGYKLVE
jgi:DNA-binding response OmpR family regulator